MRICKIEFNTFLEGCNKIGVRDREFYLTLQYLTLIWWIHCFVPWMLYFLFSSIKLLNSLFLSSSMLWWALVPYWRVTGTLKFIRLLSTLLSIETSFQEQICVSNTHPKWSIPLVSFISATSISSISLLLLVVERKFQHDKIVWAVLRPKPTISLIKTLCASDSTPTTSILSIHTTSFIIVIF